MTQLDPTPDQLSSPPVAEVVISFEAGTAMITLSGQIDLATQTGLDFAAEEAILRALPVRVDLSRVTFMDSAGSGFVARLVRAASEAGRRLTVIGPNRRIIDTLAVSGLAPFLDVSQTESWART